MAAILPEAPGRGTEWMNGYRQAQREDKAELDRLRAENAELKSENIRLETRLQDANNDLYNTRMMLEDALADSVTDAAAVPPRSEP